MTIAALLATPSELTDTTEAKCAVVLMTRIRLARNLAGRPFPSWARASQRTETLGICRAALAETVSLRRSVSTEVDKLTELDKQMLVERHLISRELSGSSGPAGVVINRDQTVAVMINEEDHLRLQVLRAGFQLKQAWTEINELDSELEGRLDYAYSPTLGYLTACPTNLGTGMRASAMMHLPALVIGSQMEQVVRAVNKLGMVVRGLFGEGSDASGSIFQISNQQTLGETEEEILQKLGKVLETIVDHELNARTRLLETDAPKLHDKIGRAFGILQQSHLLSSGEAMNLLSLLRLGIDLGAFPADRRAVVDRLLIESQPGHLQHAARHDLEPAARDRLRAERLRTEFANFAKPDFVPGGRN
jgi:protein arginine kinase